MVTALCDVLFLHCAMLFTSPLFYLLSSERAEVGVEVRRQLLFDSIRVYKVLISWNLFRSVLHVC